MIFMPPFEEEGHTALHLSVGRYVGRSVGRPDDVRSISWEPFFRFLWYFICGLVMKRGRPLLILRSIGQRSRSFKLEIGKFCPLNISRTFVRLLWYLCPTSKKGGHIALLLSVCRLVHHLFPFIFFAMDAHIEMKFGILICRKNI